MKIILHSANPDNLILMARAAKHCVGKELDEGVWGVLEYGENPIIARITYVKRKSCITLYEQPL